MHTIYFPPQNNRVSLFVDTDPDKSDRFSFSFNPGRIIPVYYYLPRYRHAYIIKAESGTVELPYIDQPVKVLLSVRTSKVTRLKKVTASFRRTGNQFQNLPDAFFNRLYQFLQSPRFRMDGVRLLYEEYYEKGENN